MSVPGLASSRVVRLLEKLGVLDSSVAIDSCAELLDIGTPTRVAPAMEVFRKFRRSMFCGFILMIVYGFCGRFFVSDKAMDSYSRRDPVRQSRSRVRRILKNHGENPGKQVV